MKVRARQIAFNHTHLAIIDGKGRVWERFHDMRLGTWGLVELPDEPRKPRVPQRRRR